MYFYIKFTRIMYTRFARTEVADLDPSLDYDGFAFNFHIPIQYIGTYTRPYFTYILLGIITMYMRPRGYTREKQKRRRTGTGNTVPVLTF